MFENDKDVSTLNSLIATTIDSADGYRQAAGTVKDADLRMTFETMATERTQAATALKSVVSTLGGTPEDDGTILAAAHRTFMDLRARITGRDDMSIVDEVERGEDHIKARFEEAMRMEGLQASTRTAIETAYGTVRTGHDQMSRTKHAMHAAAA